MKVKLFLICSIITFFSQSLKAQGIGLGKIVEFSINVPVEGTPQAFFTGADTSKQAIYLEASYKFRVLELNANDVKVMALNFTPPTTDQKTKNAGVTYKSEIYNDKIYTISRANFDAFAKEIEPTDRLAVGLLTLPFKARPQNDFTFDTEFNLNTSLNIKLFPIGSSSSINYQLGAGIGSVGLNTSNSGKLTNDEAQDVAVLTFLNGLMVQYKKIQVGVYVGVDQINNQRNYDWESNGNMWFGFGVGYSLFDVAIAPPKNSQAN